MQAHGSVSGPQRRLAQPACQHRPLVCSAALPCRDSRIIVGSRRAGDLRSAVRQAVSLPAAARGSTARRCPTQMKLSKKYAADAVSAVKLGQVESCKLGQNYCQPEHILLGILAESDGLPMEDKGIAARVLERAGVGLKKARVGVEAQSGASGKGLVLQIVEIPLSSKADAALKQAEREARRLGVPDCVCNEHILMALLAEESGATCKLLRRLGLDVGSMKEELLQLTLKETNATLPGSAPPKKGGAAQLLARLAFLPLLAGALTLAFEGALACAVGAGVLCLATLLDRHSQPAAPSFGQRYPWLRATLVTAIASAAGYFGAQLAAASAAAATVDPRLRAAAPLAGAVLALGLAANVAP